MHGAVVAHQDGLRHQRAVRDHPGLEQPELLPGVGEQGGVEFLVGEQVQGSPGYVLVRDQGRVRADLGGGRDPAGADPGGHGGVGDQRLVLQAGAQRAHHSRVRGGAQPQPTPDPLEQGGDQGLPVEQQDVEIRAAVRLADQEAVRAGRDDGLRTQPDLS